MKYFALLLSIYTLYLVSAPCVDEVLQVCNHVSGQAAHQNPDDSEHDDACSPFCICSCCNVPVTLAPCILIGQPFFLIKETLIAEPSSFCSSFFVSFWQPPKPSVVASY